MAVAHQLYTLLLEAIAMLSCCVKVGVLLPTPDELELETWGSELCIIVSHSLQLQTRGCGVPQTDHPVSRPGWRSWGCLLDSPTALLPIREGIKSSRCRLAAPSPVVMPCLHTSSMGGRSLSSLVHVVL